MNSIKSILYEIIFEHKTKGGKLFDICLIITVFVSVIAVMLETVQSLNQTYGYYLKIIEWIFTLLFTLEFILRLYCVPKPFRYLISFYGIVDIISIIPTYLSLMIPAASSFMVVRSLRMLRVFRILKLNQYNQAGMNLNRAIKNSRYKITVFLFFILILIFILGSLIYFIEGKEHGFTSIPKSIYWAIVTMTTVGYGDITPQTILGQILSSILMITGYGILAVPTGIVSSEMIRANRSLSCKFCFTEGLEDNSIYCSQCGEKLENKRITS